MTNSVIKVQNLSKRYRLGLKEKQAKTLVGQISQIIGSPLDNLKRLRDLNRFGEEDESVFWALKDVSFEVKEGEVLGIIGKNGAGKSTLLKILSQITEPTSGKIEIHGRVASLLEVGTGFHPELSGRENIYMNGTILGMTRREIDSKLDEIIDFSGVEKFIDTPVKFYSSGMKVRLGFSVAAHLDPEILIVDEVLAVGDYEFQARCLGKMESVSKSGRTVLFVSHNLEAVKSLCSRGIVLNQGEILFNGSVKLAVQNYFGLDKSIGGSYTDLRSHPEKRDRDLGLIEANICVDGVQGIEISAGQELKVSLGYKLLDQHLGTLMDVGFGLFDDEGKGLLAFNNSNFKQKVVLNQTIGSIEITIPQFPFYRSDEIYFHFYFGYLDDYYEVLTQATKLKCIQNDFLGSGKPLKEDLNSVFLPQINFQVN
ncbi:MAG: ABC-type lipopolysaccharide export system ATPase component RfbB [Algoriphagus marincola HL-49]|uniref:ABC-type lipopolysaccharide export system ATPase component RfbB n=1 Tax=Algoriphagus marincola HL-49 TaxID=1305737 RepID=A0A0N8KHD9_9BACT|nr:MAG: ABC-type lipopolysaccharide export system ATPase component RfbB [Algoriphagus marincola HL-49]